MRLEVQYVTVEGERFFQIRYGNSDMGYLGAVSHAIAPTILAGIEVASTTGE
jgi:hypothetical protein